QREGRHRLSQGRYARCRDRGRPRVHSHDQGHLGHGTGTSLFLTFRWRGHRRAITGHSADARSPRPRCAIRFVMDAPPAPTKKNGVGLKGVVAEPLDRVPVRRRESSVTASAWRLKVISDQGEGSIVLIEVTEQISCFRGDGIFLGWSQARLAEAYNELTQA